MHGDGKPKIVREAQPISTQRSTESCFFMDQPAKLDIMNTSLGGGFKYFFISPLFGEMIQFDDHIFQVGWFNHQLDLVFECL